MTSQVKGVCWSAGIHGIIICMIVLVQYVATVPQKVTVIDFTFAAPQGTSVEAEPRKGPAAPLKTRTLQTGAAKPLSEKPEQPSAVETAHVDPEKSMQRLDPADLGDAGKFTGGPSGHDPAVREGVEGGRTISGPAPGPGSSVAPREEPQAVYLREHFVYIRDRIMNGILYPEVARKMGLTGQVRIAFIVGEDGCVQNVRVVDSSGFGILDKNALDTVRRVAPFPRPPVRAEIRMAVTYQLN